VLCRNCKASKTGSITLSQQAAAQLVAGKVAVNVVTRKNKAGEIAGSISQSG